MKKQEKIIKMNKKDRTERDAIMAKHRKTIRIICFVLLIIALSLKAILFLNNNFATRIIYPFSLIALWLILDRYVLKDRSKKVELTNTKIKKHANNI